MRDRIFAGVRQQFVFSEGECRSVEKHVNELIANGENGTYKSVDEVPLRKKYFFGEGYTYGSRMHRRGPRMERLYPKGYVDPIPPWLFHCVINPLILANLIPQDFVNSVVVNDYQPNGCIVSHIDPRHIFDRPIVSLSLFSDSALCFGCKFRFRPLRCSQPVLRIPLPRGIVTTMSGFAADGITHCVRPEDIKFRRAVVILRRVLPTAPRLSLDDYFLSSTRDSPNDLNQFTNCEE